MLSHAKISCHRRMFKTLTGLSTAQSQERLPHRGMAQGGMNPETEMEKLRADSRNYLR
jgi:hypothetical protein